MSVQRFIGTVRLELSVAVTQVERVEKSHFSSEWLKVIRIPEIHFPRSIKKSESRETY